MAETPEAEAGRIIVVDPVRPSGAADEGPAAESADAEAPPEGHDAAAPVDLKPEYIRWAVQYGMEIAAWREQDHYYRASDAELDAVVPVITAQLNKLPDATKTWIANAGAVLEWQPLVNFFWRRGLHWFRVHVRHTESKWGPDGPLPLETDQGGGPPRDGQASDPGLGA